MLKYLLLIGVVLFSQIRGEIITHTQVFEEDKYGKSKIKVISYFEKTSDTIKLVKTEGYYENGQKQSEVIYKDDNLFSNTEWYENGQKYVLLYFKDGEWELYDIWNEDGSVKE